MTFDEILRLGMLVAVIASTATNVWMWLKTRSDDRFKAFDARLTGLAEQRRANQEQLAQHGNRISAIEARLSGLPTHNDLSEIRADISAVNERTEMTHEIVRSLQNFLMNQSARQ